MAFDARRFFYAMGGVDIGEEERKSEAHASKMATEESSRWATQQAIRSQQMKQHEARQVQEALEAGYSERPENDEVTFDFNKGTKYLKDTNQGHLIPAFQEEFNAAVKREATRKAAPLMDQAVSARMVIENHDTDKKVTMQHLRRLVPGATDYNMGADGTMYIATEDGKVVSESIADLEQRLLSGAEFVKARETMRHNKAMENEKPDLVQQYEYARREGTAAQRSAFAQRFPSYADYVLAMKKAAGGFDPESQSQKTLMALNKDHVAKRLDAVDEATKGLPNLYTMRSMLKAGVVVPGPGEPAKLKWRQFKAAFQNFFGAEIPQDILDEMTGPQMFDAVSKMVAYANRAEFMPGQLSNIEGEKLENMVVNLSKTPEAAMMVLDVDIARKERLRTMKGEMRQFMHDTNSLMVAPTGVSRTIEYAMRDKSGKLVRKKGTETFFTWQEYEDRVWEQENRAMRMKLEDYAREKGIDAPGPTPPGQLRQETGEGAKKNMPQVITLGNGKKVRTYPNGTVEIVK